MNGVCMYIYTLQINARLYAFDAATHSWKERGRGDIRLNDSCQSEGVFQSRLGEIGKTDQLYTCMCCEHIK